MNLIPLLTASAPIQIHLALALLALGLGTTVLMLKKGTAGKSHLNAVPQIGQC